MEMTARTIQRVYSGRYFMNMRDMREAMNMRYACWSRRGPNQWMLTIPITPKFHTQMHKVIQSMPRL